jgi:TolB-like protein
VILLPMPNHSRMTLWILAVATLCVGIAACSPVSVDSNGATTRKGMLFRHRWWNYYTRALTAMEAQDGAAAKADLASAIALSHRDRRMARTYGMHFIDYFPHRELGILHWLDGDLASAHDELERSIEHYPTAKARFYLDEVRKALLRQRGGEFEPPELTLDSTPGIIRTRDHPFRIRGTARDANYVSALRVMGESIFMEGSQTSIAFDHPLYLSSGEHRIEIEADNLAGKLQRHGLTLIVDRAGPVVVLDRCELFDDQLVLQGSVLDDAGVDELKINGKAFSTRGLDEIPFTHFLPVDTTDIVIECRDTLGNENRAVLDTSAPRAFVGPSKWLAGLELAGLFSSLKPSSPMLHLEDWLESQTVYMDKIVVSGHVRDAGQVVSLTINGREVLPRPGALVFFSEVIGLQPGSNSIHLVARNRDKRSVERRIAVQRKIPAAQLLDHRLRVTIFPFQHKGENASAGIIFQDSFIHQMVKPARFQVVERSRLDLILQEQKISRSQLADDATAIQLGRLAVAQAIVTGSLVETRTGIEIVGRVVDSETSDVLVSVDAYSEDRDMTGYRSMAQTMSLKIHREFPLADGRVVNKRGNMIFTDLGRSQLRAQRRILVYAEESIVDPITGNRLGVDHNVLGFARITQVQDDISKAQLNADSDSMIDVHHKVIPQ